MPRGDKSSYTDKQKRQAEHIEESYEERGVSGGRGGAPRLGHRQQVFRRRQEERVGARQAGEQRPRQEGRPGFQGRL